MHSQFTECNRPFNQSTGDSSLSYGRTVIENIFSQIQLSDKENNTNEICSEIKFRNKIVCHNIFFSYQNQKIMS